MNPIRWINPVKNEVKEHIIRYDLSHNEARDKIIATWRRWLSRRAGPLLWCRGESNNPFDFYSSDDIADIPISRFVSFVDAGKGYCMDSKSAKTLMEYAEKNKETPLNPFNRNPLPQLFLTRLARHGKMSSWEGLVAKTETQQASLVTTDLFRTLEDLGNYTDPSWFMDLTRIQLQQLYIELADIWFHRAGLDSNERKRIVPPPNRPFYIPVNTVMIMNIRALRPLLLETCRILVSSADARGDRQLGATYILGSLSLVNPSVGIAYDWLMDAFAPGVTRILSGHLIILHPAVMSY